MYLCRIPVYLHAYSITTHENIGEGKRKIIAENYMHMFLRKLLTTAQFYLDRFGICNVVCKLVRNAMKILGWLLYVCIHIRG